LAWLGLAWLGLAWQDYGFGGGHVKPFDGFFPDLSTFSWAKKLG
jgi:hypothetical protein